MDNAMYALNYKIVKEKLQFILSEVTLRPKVWTCLKI